MDEKEKNIVEETSTQAVEETANAATPVVENKPVKISAKVLKVLNDLQDASRLNIQTNVEFDTIDISTGTKKKTVSFGIAKRAVISNLVECGEEHAADIAACDTDLSSVIPTEVFAYLVGADIAFTRTHHLAEDKRQDGKEYGQECYTTQILTCIAHPSERMIRKHDEALDEWESKNKSKQLSKVEEAEKKHAEVIAAILAKLQ